MSQFNRRTVSAGFRLGFEVLGLVCAWYCTLYLRVMLNPVLAKHLQVAELIALAPPVSLVLALWLPARFSLRNARFAPAFAGSYSILRVLESAALATGLVIVVTFFRRQFGADLSRSFVLLFMPVSLVVMLITQYIGVLILTATEDKWGSPERVAIVGYGEEARRLAQRVIHAREPAVLAGMILPENSTPYEAWEDAPILGTTSRLAEVINRTHLDRIIIIQSSITEREVDACGTISRKMGVVLSRCFPLPEVGVRVDFSRSFGVPLIDSRAVPFAHRQEIIKRWFDIVATVVLLALMCPVLLVFAVLIKLTSEGPLFYSAPRVGRGGRYFSFLKFRSMYTDRMSRKEVVSSNEKNGKLFKIKNDPRVTPLGRFMRKYSIDELPQLLNVLRGDMSLIGPRPLPVEDLDPDGQSQEFATWSEQRSRVLPGITGLWQIKGRSDLSFEDMIKFDLDYIRNWSLELDLHILLVTPLVVLSGKGAY
jgi:exopolysaccharide biosynthesis polyprenyl glycosylphosphotransferase